MIFDFDKVMQLEEADVNEKLKWLRDRLDRKWFDQVAEQIYKTTKFKKCSLQNKRLVVAECLWHAQQASEAERIRNEELLKPTEGKE